jgi:hypothetical protein
LAIAPRLQRVRDFLVATLSRPLLFAFWAFVLWGTLLILVFGVRVASASLAEAVASLWPERADGLAYANLGAVVLATLVWLTVAVIAVRSRRARP